MLAFLILVSWQQKLAQIKLSQSNKLKANNYFWLLAQLHHSTERGVAQRGTT